MTDAGAFDGRSPNGQAFSQTVTADDIRELLEGQDCDASRPTKVCNLHQQRQTLASIFTLDTLK